MSMFHELMMRKKEEIMYATIKGTLTENNGVFSGFSSSDYLALQHIIDFSKPFEILLKFIPTDFTTPLFLFSTRYITNSGFDIYIQNSKIRIWGSTNGTSLDISSYSIDTININTTYWYKLKYSPTQIIAELSTDGINFVQENNIALSNQIYQNNYNALIGHGQTTNTNYFVGSIDLNKSYIKLGSTKYNLQAVVGYTVVGSPTITDGVVSGTGSTNHLILPEYPNIENVSKIELQIKYSATTNVGGVFFYFDTTSNGNRLQTLSSGQIRWYSPNITFASNKAMTNYHYIKVIMTNGLGNNVEIYVSVDGVSWEKATITQSENTVTFINGIIHIFRCAIDSYDLKETYVKINNKLWFNGQQA